ncbi:MAG: hypothetical protein PHU25_22295 [Deltaproteobacteria bacterium]|nr:hypothetical protein [Deltaproteobacteria bacterium]
MTFDSLVERVGVLPWFDLATVLQLSGEPRATALNQLSRFARAGKIVPLRRGMYVLAERYRRTAVQPAALANALYRPSYLSGAWALSFYGLIPEGAPVFTSVTTRSPKRFENAFGEFEYRNVKRPLFFGSTFVRIGGEQALVAAPEKALVDLWHLSRGEWTEARMREMRPAQNERLDPAKLESLVLRLGSPRISRAFAMWSRVVAEDGEGEVTL